MAIGTLGSKQDATKTSSPAARSEVRCDRFAAPSGNDGSRGTKEAAVPDRAAPCRLATRRKDRVLARRRLQRDGGRIHPPLDHGGSEQHRITIRSFPGERAKLVGIVYIVSGANYVALTHLAIEGTGDHNTVKIYSTDTVVRNNDITNASRGESCMILGNESDGQAVRTLDPSEPLPRLR